MRDYDFSQVEAVILDSQHNTLRLFRDVLTRLGIKKVEVHSSIRDATPELLAVTPDLVIVSADGDDEAEAFRLIRTLRNDPSSQNPYSGLIVTTWKPTQALLTRVSTSGADDLLMKPVSPKQVRDRIVALIEGRKSFVVTADYIGPDRRKSPREGTQVPLIDAPNTLRLKAGGRTANLRQLLAEANALVGDQKLKRISIQIAFLLDFASPGLSKAEPERMAIEHLARIPGFAEEMVQRLPAIDGDGDQPSAPQTCRELKGLAEKIRVEALHGPVPGASLTHAWELACALMRAVDSSRSLELMTQEVKGAVAGYRGRLERLVQAKAAERAAGGAEEAAKGASAA